MAAETFILYDDVNVSITITELDDGSLKFDVKVLDDTGSIGDLNALFFDLADDSLTNGLSIDGADVTDTALKVDGVTKIDSYTNMNGEVVKDLGKFDGGVQFGTQGIGVDDIRETSFTLSHDTEALSLADFSLQDFGIRLTSVGEEGGSRDGSLKIGDTAPEFPEEPPEPPVSQNEAIADSMTVTEKETFSPSLSDALDGAGDDPMSQFASSLLNNDLTDEMPYLGSVTAVNGSESLVSSKEVAGPEGLQVVEGSNGGAIYIFEDGTIDFSAFQVGSPISDFDYLAEGETATTDFAYSIEGGSSATLVVTVVGIADDGGPGDPPPPPPDGIDFA